MTDELILEIAREYQTVVPGNCLYILEFARALLSASKPAVPIDMLLFCPNCGTQHIDAPEEHERDEGLSVRMDVSWTNPPHRSHLCHACECIWRPADVPTNGVAAITTKGKADTWSAASPAAPIQEPATEFKAGICVALQAITACDNGVLWSELVRACGTDEMLYYAAHVEPAEWELAGFAKYARAELGKKKPAKRASPPDSGKQEPTRWQKAQMAFGGGELTDAAPAQSDKQFAIYQLRMANGSWIDQTEQSYKSNIEQGHGGSVRVLYAISQTAQPGEKR